MSDQWEVIDERELRHAAQLIETERYDEARQLLRGMNNEPARQLMAQIPEQKRLEPEPKVKRKAVANEPDPATAQVRLVVTVFFVTLLICACIIISSAASTSSRYRPTPRPYATTNPSLIMMSCIEQPLDEDCFNRAWMYDQCRGLGYDADTCSRQVNDLYPREP